MKGIILHVAIVIFSFSPSQGQTADDHQGIGQVFIVESYSKPNKKGGNWITFFDIETKKNLISERMLGSTGGIGLRNYLAKTYLNVMMEAGRKFDN